jgi:hypothetical protein
MTDFKRGDVVEILEQYRDTGDELLTWVVEEDSEKGRVTIVASDSPMSLKPRYVVETAWIRLSSASS